MRFTLLFFLQYSHYLQQIGRFIAGMVTDPLERQLILGINPQQLPPIQTTVRRLWLPRNHHSCSSQQHVVELAAVTHQLQRLHLLKGRPRKLASVRSVSTRNNRPPLPNISSQAAGLSIFCRS